MLAGLCEAPDRRGGARVDAARLDRRVAYLSWAQQRRVVEVTLAAAAGRVQVVAGVAATTTAEAVRQAVALEGWAAPASSRSSRPISRCRRTGSSPISARSPQAVRCPVVLYTDPQFQRSDLSLGAIERLAEVPNMRYLKDASTNTRRLLSIMSQVSNQLGVFSASAHVPACVMLLGGKGWMAGPACLIPRQSMRLYELCRAGHWAEAMALQRALWGLNDLFAATMRSPPASRAGSKLQGFPVGDPLPPRPVLERDRPHRTPPRIERDQGAVATAGPDRKSGRRQRRTPASRRGYATRARRSCRRCHGDRPRRGGRATRPSPRDPAPSG